MCRYELSNSGRPGLGKTAILDLARAGEIHHGILNYWLRLGEVSLDSVRIIFSRLLSLIYGLLIIGLPGKLELPGK